MPFGTSSTIDSRAQDDLIRARGEWVKYYVGSRCPCGDQTNRPDYACPNCQGTGHFYPNPPVNMCAIIADVNLNRDPFGIPGFAIPGDLYMSVRPARGQLPTVYDWDMVQLAWKEGIPQEGEDVIASPTGIDQLANPIVQVFSAYGIDPNNTAGPNFIVTYVPDVDFVLVPATGTQLHPQSIQWVTTNRPAAGHKYVIKYSSQPLWIVFSPPKPHFERGVSFGQSCLLRKRSLIIAGNSGSFPT